MKGIVFTEFFEMVEEKFGYEMVDDLISTTDLSSEGIYTSVGVYEHTEMVNLVVNLGEKTKIPVEQLLKIFGGYLFKTFTKSYGHFMTNAPDTFTFLASIHKYIHVEVQKLYPDAELPHFSIERTDENTLTMIYTSERKMADLAFGLIEGCAEHYKESVEISQVPMNEDGSITKFVIIRK